MSCSSRQMASRPNTRQHSKTLEDYLDEPIVELFFDKERATKSVAWHKGKSLAIEVVRWDDFEATIDGWKIELLERLQKDPKSSGNQDATCIFPSSEEKDSVLCGNELSVQGRFIQHAAKPVQDLLCIYKIACQISDFSILKARSPKYASAAVQTTNQASSKPDTNTAEPTSGKAHCNRLPGTWSRAVEDKARDSARAQDWKARHIPNIIVCKNEGRLALLVGELKTPWNHNLRDLAFLFRDEDDREDIQEDAQLWLGK